MSAKMAHETDTDDEQTSKASLMNYVSPKDAPDDALTMRQLLELQDGVRAAIENGDRGLGAPGNLTDSQWSHAGVGISVYMHPSGVVVMTKSGDSIVTAADAIDHMSQAQAKFFATIGHSTVESSNPE